MGSVHKLRSDDKRAYQQRHTVDAGKLPASARNAPFVFVHYANSWEFHPEYGFVPVLSQINYRPAVNGVGDADGRLQVNHAHAGSDAKGGRRIMPDDPKLGEFADYVRMHDCQGGGFHFCCAWDEFEVLPNGAWKNIPQPEEYMRFRVFLRDNQYLHLLSDTVFAGIREREAKKLERLIRRRGQHPYMADQVVAQQERIAAMDKAWEAYNGALSAEATVVKSARKGKSAAQVIKDAGVSA